jgi:hypothetical protein
MKPHGQIGVTTVGEVRKAGGDVIRTSGRGYHATLTGLTSEQISNLLTPTIPKPKPYYNCQIIYFHTTSTTKITDFPICVHPRLSAFNYFHPTT